MFPKRYPKHVPVEVRGRASFNAVDILNITIIKANKLSRITALSYFLKAVLVKAPKQDPQREVPPLWVGKNLGQVP